MFTDVCNVYVHGMKCVWSTWCEVCMVYMVWRVYGLHGVKCVGSTWCAVCMVYMVCSVYGLHGVQCVWSTWCEECLMSMPGMVCVTVGTDTNWPEYCQICLRFGYPFSINQQLFYFSINTVSFNGLPFLSCTNVRRTYCDCKLGELSKRFAEYTVYQCMPTTYTVSACKNSSHICCKIKKLPTTFWVSAISGTWDPFSFVWLV